MKYEEIKQISQQIESPSFYVLDVEKFRNTCRKLEKAFTSRYEKYRIAYSVKTNYCPRIVSEVNRLGGFAEIVSDFEYEIAVKAGFRKSDIIFNGPVKNLSASIDLLKNGGTVIIDNEEELDALAAASPRDKTWNVGIRCNLEVNPEKISRFGFDVYSPRFDEILRKLQDHFHVKIVHCHMSGFRELAYWEKRAEKLIDIARRLDTLPEIIDLGSGMFGEMEDSFKEQFHKEIPTFDQYAEPICRLFNESFGSLPVEKRPWIVTEPGTTVVANALSFYCPVISCKNIRGKDFVELMGSAHNIGAELAPKKNLPCSRIPCMGDGKTYQVKNAELVGYTCLEYDSLQRGISGEIQLGDYFEFRNVGSYSNVLKPPFILPNFPMITFSCGKIEILKRKEENSDLYHTYVF